MRRVAKRHGLAVKILAAALLAAAADLFFYFHGVGATLGGFALIWAALLAMAAPGIRYFRPARLMVLLACVYALILIEAPSFLGWTLFWVALSSAVLLVRRRFDNAGDWAVRLAAHVFRGMLSPVADLLRLARLWRAKDAARIGNILRILALPCIGGALFFMLFAGANPVIGDFLASIRLPLPWDAAFHLCFWLFILWMVWPSLRPAPAVTRHAPLSFELPEIRAIPRDSIALSLLVFNAIFLLQNLLDIAFLWSGAPLPGTITLADYAHRGAYLLVATALLAGLFVLLFLHPGSDAARRPAIRRLVVLWIAQNLLLVTSSILRTWDYVQAYSLTVLRISALVWMALVGVGLFLICWRMIARRSTRWLLNANALAAALVLSIASVTDLGATAAWWNVRHSDRVGRTGNAIDLCYLHSLGSSALLPVIDLEKRARGPLLQDSVAAIRADLLARLAADQADWHRWTWRGARRLVAARAALGPDPRRPLPIAGRDCDGSPLTNEAEQ